MIIHLSDHSEIDTERDLHAEEKHILQKLLCYKYFVGSVAEFRQKKEAAFRVGWNDSGPVRESATMARIAEQLEAELRLRLENPAGHPEL
jgi:hypothetical protein